MMNGVSKLLVEKYCHCMHCFWDFNFFTLIFALHFLFTISPFRAFHFLIQFCCLLLCVKFILNSLLCFLCLLFYIYCVYCFCSINLNSCSIKTTIKSLVDVTATVSYFARLLIFSSLLLLTLLFVSIFLVTVFL